jgi:hypothetical protein
VSWNPRGGIVKLCPKCKGEAQIVSFRLEYDLARCGHCGYEFRRYATRPGVVTKWKKKGPKGEKAGRITIGRGSVWGAGLV